MCADTTWVNVILVRQRNPISGIRNSCPIIHHITISTNSPPTHPRSAQATAEKKEKSCSHSTTQTPAQASHNQIIIRCERARSRHVYGEENRKTRTSHVARSPESQRAQHRLPYPRRKRTSQERYDIPPTAAPAPPKPIIDRNCFRRARLPNVATSSEPRLVPEKNAGENHTERPL